MDIEVSLQSSATHTGPAALMRESVAQVWDKSFGLVFGPYDPMLSMVVAFVGFFCLGFLLRLIALLRGHPRARANEAGFMWVVAPFFAISIIGFPVAIILACAGVATAILPPSGAQR